jgi:hypothetical protein
MLHEKAQLSWALHVQPPPSQVVPGVTDPPEAPDAPDVPPSASPLPIVKS